MPTARPFLVRISNRSEVRMGSPYNICNIELIGQHLIDLPRSGWQDKIAWSNDSKRLVLVELNLEKNEPAFHLFIIDTTTGKTIKGSKISGLVNNISMSGDIIRLNRFLFDREKFERQQDCNIDEVYSVGDFE